MSRTCWGALTRAFTTISGALLIISAAPSVGAASQPEAPKASVAAHPPVSPLIPQRPHPPFHLPQQLPGSLVVGSARYAIPAGALYVSASGGSDSGTGAIGSPLRTVRAAVAHARSGQTIVLRGGVYHESVFVAADRSVVIDAYPGEAVWFDGSVPVRLWHQTGSTWVKTDWTSAFDHSASFTRGSNVGGFVNPAYPMAAYPDEVFYDGRQMTQVAAGHVPGPGGFAVDTAKHTITIGSNPSGHELRASDLSQAFLVAGRVELRGFGVRNYATALPQLGTIFLGGAAGGDALENLVVDNNATQGISICTKNSTINKVTVSNNGMTGIHGNQADGAVIQNSLIEANNAQHFNAAPSASGIKVTQTRGLTVRDNRVDSNNGVNGIWTDQSVVNFTIVSNVVQGSTPYGIETEISDTGIVAGNKVAGAKFGYVAYNTGHVQVYNNTFAHDTVYDVGVVQDERRESDASIHEHDTRQPIPDATCPWIAQDVTVANNIFDNGSSVSTALFQFYALDRKTHRPADSMAITIEGNLFTTRRSSYQPSMIGWGGSDNTTVVRYDTSAAFDQAKDKTWTNTLTPTAPVSSATVAANVPHSVPLPASVAAVLGLRTGVRMLGAP